eukprot:SAG31_NODE_843_length_11551_cov_6.757772_10_plen_55_part_00
MNMRLWTSEQCTHRAAHGDVCLKDVSRLKNATPPFTADSLASHKAPYTSAAGSE